MEKQKDPQTPPNRPMSVQKEEAPGWHELPPEALPRPTYWPAALALGVVFLLWGIVSSFIISLVGLILMIVALVGWIGELRHEG